VSVGERVSAGFGGVASEADSAQGQVEAAGDRQSGGPVCICALQSCCTQRLPICPRFGEEERSAKTMYVDL
jgi:hypothetical protein